MNSQHFCINNGTTKIGLVFVFLVAFLSLDCHVMAQKKEFIVMLDAGHGGHDSGNIGIKKIKEKDVALNIALEVGKLLENTPNIKVLYTRKKDVFICEECNEKVKQYKNGKIHWVKYNEKPTFKAFYEK